MNSAIVFKEITANTFCSGSQELYLSKNLKLLDLILCFGDTSKF